MLEEEEGGEALSDLRGRSSAVNLENA